MLCTEGLSLALKEMPSLGFHAYVILYLSNATLDSSLKIPFEQGFCIGLHCSPTFWNCSPGEREL